MTVTTSERAYEVLAELVYSMNDVLGALLASPDGRPVAADLPPTIGEKPTAAFVASAFGLGARIVELVGPAPVNELMVSSDSGTVVVYSVMGKGALIVLTRPSVNLALLNRKARAATLLLVPALEDGKGLHT